MEIVRKSCYQGILVLTHSHLFWPRPRLLKMATTLQRNFNETLHIASFPSLSQQI